MFCGRETYARAISIPLKNEGIFGSFQAVNTALNRLKRKGDYLIRTRSERGISRGRPPVFYTANLEPILITLKYIFMVDKSKEERFKKYIETLIKKISVLNDAFPKAYVSLNEEENGRINFKNMRWYDLLGTFFLSAFCHLYSPGMKIDKVLEKAIEKAFEKSRMCKMYASSYMPFLFPFLVQLFKKDLGISSRVDIPGITDDDKFFLLIASGLLTLESMGMSSLRKALINLLPMPATLLPQNLKKDRKKDREPSS